MWLKDANCFGMIRWREALDAVAVLNAPLGSYACEGYTATYNDWVLPNINEMESLINVEEPDPAVWLNGQGIEDVMSDLYWSSTTSAYLTSSAWIVHLNRGHISYDNKTGSHYVWPVRTSNTQPATVWKTGQVISYKPGDDGALQRGVEWPTPRFTDNKDGTVTDNLTGLMWLRDANCFAEMTWQDVFDKVVDFNANPDYYCVDYRGAYNDWRLPNRKELYSFTDFSRYDPILPVGHPFLNVQSYRYWSSTTYVGEYYTENAWYISIHDGVVSGHPKLNVNHMWPVRAGGTTEPPGSHPPIADSGADQIAFDEVTLDGSGSYDPDGQIVSYAWELKHRENSSYDRSAEEVNPTVSNLEPGYYDVILTVTDTNGLEDTDSMVVAAAGPCVCVASTMHIESIGVTVLKADQGQKFGQAVVKVFDDCGRLVPGASVTGSFTGDYTEQITVLTGSDGASVLTTSMYVKKKPSFAFCVDDVIQETLTYEPINNAESCENLN